MLFTLSSLALAVALALPPTSLPQPVDSLENLVAQVEKERELTDPAILAEIGAIGSRDAAEALIKLYGGQGSLYIRLHILRQLPLFDSKEDCGQMVSQHLMAEAVGSEESELREAALDAMSECPKFGRGFFETIVNSHADSHIRTRALGLHMEKATEVDHEWYRKIYEKELVLDGIGMKAAKRAGAKAKKGSKSKDEGEPIDYPVAAIMQMTFKQLRGEMDKDELTTALEMGTPEIRLMAFEELVGRNLKVAAKMAEPLYKHPEEQLDMRILAAETLAAASAKKMTKRFITDAGKFATPEALRVATAKILADLNDESTNKKLKTLIKKGDPHERRFAIRALRDATLKDLDEDVGEVLNGDEDMSVRRVAAYFLAQRGVQSATPGIEALLASSKTPDRAAEMLELLGLLQGQSDEWRAKLREYTEHKDSAIRNAAVRQLGNPVERASSETLDLLEGLLAHADWSTRLAALNALGQQRQTRSLGPIVTQMQEEIGRLRVEFGDILYSLTGKSFRPTPKIWKAWWEEQGGNFEVISAEELARVERQRELRRLQSATNSKFFGIRIISQRVIFVIDVSGSMEESLRPAKIGDLTETRMDVARRELLKAIMGLENGVLYNVLAFSAEVTPWHKDGMAALQEADRDEVKKYVGGLRPGGGTNLFDALEHAFADKEVDTIFVLSDGEPSMGAITDPTQIRSTVARWNKNRGITINTIGIGSNLRILEWLAEDSGGKSVLLN